MAVKTALLCLIVHALGKDARRANWQTPKYPLCENADVEVREGTGTGSCVVTNRAQEGRLVRVMCGGADANKDAKTDPKKKDHDVATYLYIPPRQTVNTLEGQCRGGHRCRICGATAHAAPTKGQDPDNKDFLQNQNYECRRRCEVVLYKHEDYNGELQTFSHNAAELFGSNLQDKISAIKILGQDCEVTLYKEAYYQNKLCTFNSGTLNELAIDYHTLKGPKVNDKNGYSVGGCGCNDCITSMSIRETKRCGPESFQDGGKTKDCKPCGDGPRTIGCCYVPKHRHGQVAQREEALKRLFKAMADVLEE